MQGRKRHLLVDTLGLLIVVLITSAGLDDGSAAPPLLVLISATAFPRLETIFGDNKYHNHALQAWMATHRPMWRLEVKTRPEGSTGFTPLRQRWVVERTHAWNGRDRRNSKDYERKPTSSAIMIQPRRFLKKNILYQDVETGWIRISQLDNSGWRSSRSSTIGIARLLSATPF